MAIQRNVLRVARSVKNQIRGLLRQLEGDTRAQQLRDEVHYWRWWFANRGNQWPDDYLSRLDPNYPLQSHVSRFVERLQGDLIDILDIGAGPITSLGKVHPHKKIVITATDLLALKYDGILDEFDIIPAVRTVFADADNLQNTFKAKKT